MQQAEELGMSAAEVITQLANNFRVGKDNGFGCGEETLDALRSDYVRLAASLLRVRVRLEPSGFRRTAHPWWVWIERVR